MTENRKPTFCTVVVVNLLLLSLLMFSAQSSAQNRSSVELSLRPSELVNGVPKTMGFVFVNTVDHEVRIPPVSPCIPGRYSGMVKLNLEFLPLRPQIAGKAGGCGGAASHNQSILEQVKSWKRLQPGESLTLSYQRSELSVSEEAAGAYELWGQYQPPQLTAEDMTALEHAGIDFPSQPLRSAHLHFNRPN